MPRKKTPDRPADGILHKYLILSAPTLMELQDKINEANLHYDFELTTISTNRDSFFESFSALMTRKGRPLLVWTQNQNMNGGRIQ